MWDTHHHHVPVVGCSFHLKSFTKWRLSPNWSHFGKYSSWLFFLSFQIADWIIKRNISFSPACYLDCSPSTQQYSKRIEMIKCLIIVFSQEKVPPNMLTLTLMFDNLIKCLRDVHFKPGPWRREERVENRASFQPAPWEIRFCKTLILARRADTTSIVFCKKEICWTHWFLQKAQIAITLASN